MIAPLVAGVSFVRTGLMGPAVRRLLRMGGRFPARPALGARVALPFDPVPEHLCFACSPRNDEGLKLAFHEAAGFDLACAWRPDPRLTNYPGMVHGGLAATVLDELLGQAIFRVTRHLPVSVEASVRWHKPLKVGEDTVAAARIGASYERFYAASAWLFRADGKVAVEVSGRYYTPTLSQFRKMAELETVLPVARGWFAPSRRAKATAA